MSKLLDKKSVPLKSDSLDSKCDPLDEKRVPGTRTTDIERLT